jgi:hypothetical protein
MAFFTISRSPAKGNLFTVESTASSDLVHATEKDRRSARPLCAVGSGAPWSLVSTYRGSSLIASQPAAKPMQRIDNHLHGYRSCRGHVYLRFQTVCSCAYLSKGF